MNERIKLLAEQAGAKELGADLYGGEFIGAIRLDFLEKFAELIIKECAKICRDGIVTDNDWDHSYWDQACENRATAIRTHFGVKE